MSTSGPPVDLWYVGVLIYASSATCMAGGIILQKYSLVCEASRGAAARPSYMQPLWLLGVTAYTMSAIGLSGALYFAAQSLLSPLMSVVLVANAILARLVLKESFGRHEAISTSLIICSVVITTIFADHGNQQYSEATLIEYYHQGPFIAYCVVVATALAVLYALNWHYAKRAGDLLNNALLLDDAEWATTMLDDKVGDPEVGLRATGSRATGEGGEAAAIAAIAADAGGWRRTGTTAISIADEAAAEWGEQREGGAAAAAAGRSLSKAQSLAVMERRVSRVLPFTYGALAGVFGGVCSCMMKSAISVIATEAGKGVEHMLETWLVYLLVALLALLWLGQMRWINKGVARFPATYVVAIEAIVNELTGVTGGMLYFQEYQGMSAGSLWGFMSGLALGVAGVVVLARKPVAPRRTATERSADSKQTSSGYASGEQPFSSTSSVALLDDPQ